MNEVYDADEFIVGDALGNADVLSRLTDAESRRTLRQAANDHDQQWFHRAPNEAAYYVRQRIGRARKTVLIVDPYFAGRELLAFGHAIRRPDVALRILTSTQGLRRDGLGDSSAASGRVLMRVLDDTFRDYPIKPEIRVLTGNPPPVHDRFLVVDGTTWFSGNSLNTLGERARDDRQAARSRTGPHPPRSLVARRAIPFRLAARAIGCAREHLTPEHDSTIRPHASTVSMSAQLLPGTTVRDPISVRRYSAPSDEPRLLWPSIRYREGIESYDSSSFPAKEVVYERRRVHVEHVHDRGKVHHEGIVLKLVAFPSGDRECGGPHSGARSTFRPHRREGPRPRTAIQPSVGCTPVDESKRHR